MGLDMYLSAKRFVGGHHTETAKFKQLILRAVGEMPGELTYVTAEACYWRKANHIHAWFVEHVQKGEDNGGDYYVSREQLTLLRDTCRVVIANPAEEGPAHLPTQAGFFFGNTEYDTYYMDEVMRTEERLTELLETTAFDDWDFEYNASW